MPQMWLPHARAGGCGVVLVGWFFSNVAVPRARGGTHFLEPNR